MPRGWWFWPAGVCGIRSLREPGFVLKGHSSYALQIAISSEIAVVHLSLVMISLAFCQQFTRSAFMCWVVMCRGCDYQEIRIKSINLKLCVLNKKWVQPLNKFPRNRTYVFLGRTACYQILRKHTEDCSESRDTSKNLCSNPMQVNSLLLYRVMNQPRLTH